VSEPPRLENRLPPENLLERDEHPLRELAWLLGASLVLLALVVLITGWAARWLAPRLPFALEVALAERVVDGPPPVDQGSLLRRAALQDLAAERGAPMTGSGSLNAPVLRSLPLPSAGR